MIIGLAGLAGSGKTTVQQILVRRYGFQSVNFADPLKRMALAINPIIWPASAEEAFKADGRAPLRLGHVVNWNGWEAAKAYPEARRFLQRLGTDGVRHQDESFWIRAWREEVDSRGQSSTTDGDTVHIIAGDVRFENEVRAITDRDGIVIRVERPGLNPLPNDGSAHISEHLDPNLCHVVIVNDGTLVDLEDRVISMMEKL